MKQIDLVDLVEAWKSKPVWVRAMAWFMAGIIVGTLIK